ncbi:hypothetical protein TNIN_455291 [Trichonephila inaurata madagascariensis]|uniref:Uncharacterized protein n=1 Tax=Trichonephila inaurata madagascariensis TaxID=2747483 RepID=A0A8X6MGI3_9ARAC|nr:hypothetical protein TNIN_455291 [Trichonephila inaurata madagascariensis]
MSGAFLYLAKKIASVLEELRAVFRLVNQGSSCDRYRVIISDSEKNPTKPETDCVRRRNAMPKLNQLDVLLTGYKKFIAYQKPIDDDSGFAN